MIFAKIKLVLQKIFKRIELFPGKNYKITYSSSPVCKLLVRQYINGKWDTGVIIKSGNTVPINSKTKGVSIVVSGASGTVSNLSVVKQ